ncbi:methyltransferase-like protein 22 [Corythoichthys intestinalis]|uniref:methyltransferase-like protein 22 n=1 Tax=Corythoichthys intestinalis TaxID=161448 RepID=UPI0025A5E001|nr:methyltransferase-like protein 22 [Corythoichthys intestinalis]XP_057674001.1 methyltransferase-like protein 22 [Corythoichthys intestinalis]XP_061805982.1 methyltransferase-like protein 22 [Nerophis lumbriciformis]
MNQIIFQHDSVLSDVHMLLPNAHNIMTRLNKVGQPVFISKFKFLSNAEKQDRKCEATSENSDCEAYVTQGKDRDEKHERTVAPALDEDGDLDIPNRPRNNVTEDCTREVICPVILRQSDTSAVQNEVNTDDEADECFDDIIRIEHTMATPLEDVGKQVWRGALLLADFILSQPLMFKGATVIELGAGVGLTSVIMSTLAKRVYCTDVGDDLLSMCQRNIVLNEQMIELAGGEVRVRQLDWLRSDLCTDADVELSWTEEEVADIHDNVSFIIAADVCYDDDLTDGFFRTLYRLCSNFAHNCTIFISIEKRFNFTLQKMDVSCDAYNHFQHCLSQLEDMVDGKCLFTVEQLPSTFPQFLQYERIDQLELWKVTANRVSFDKDQSNSQELTS